MQLRLAGMWLKCKSLCITLNLEKRFYLKYLTPSEYTQIRDHRRDSAIPLRLALGGIFQFDNSFTEINQDELPVDLVFSITLEESTALECAQGNGSASNQDVDAQGQNAGNFSFETEFPVPDFFSLPE